MPPPTGSLAPPPRDWRRIALWLVAATQLYNIIEAGVALWAAAAARSIALLGFGLDSLIETAAAGAMLYHLWWESRPGPLATDRRESVQAPGDAGRPASPSPQAYLRYVEGADEDAAGRSGCLCARSRSVVRGPGEGRDPEQIEGRERAVHRFVGLTLLLLAVYVVGQSAWTLWRRQAAAESVVGICLAAASLVIMPVVSFYKLRAARQVGSRALAAEAKETLACSYLSFCLLAGLVANAVAGWWWADPLAALLMVPWLVHEGLEGFEEEEDEE